MFCFLQIVLHNNYEQKTHLQILLILFSFHTLYRLPEQYLTETNFRSIDSLLKFGNGTRLRIAAAAVAERTQLILSEGKTANRRQKGLLIKSYGTLFENEKKKIRNLLQFVTDVSQR